MTSKIAALIIPALFLATSSLHAEEKNGMMLNVAKKTLDRKDNSGYYYRHVTKTQALKITLKNTSFKERSAGEIRWTILSRSDAYSSRIKYTGTEALKALKPSESVEFIVGAAQMSDYRYYGNSRSSELDYQVVVFQDGAETIRTETEKTFDSLVQTAVVLSDSAQGGNRQATNIAATPAKPTTQLNITANTKPTIVVAPSQTIVRPASTVTTLNTKAQTDAEDRKKAAEFDFFNLKK